jgi:hypothetical protein
MWLARRTRRIALQSVLAGMAMSVVAMGVAAAGWLPAVWGALLQEAIDLAVILNALRALSPGRREPAALTGAEPPGRPQSPVLPQASVSSGAGIVPAS